ncbi:alpha/beta hydrolase [Mycolicibacterium confluentis]|uniref:alpha/beta hydrolase n=1 Tax=Mycolicibacterium confluentis TaxID=28047 RepID=UPI000A14BB6A|nr:alpha/beta hydrolase [Mycolicibacterium confluentis]MCV7318179.1 alpha/beta hydrolase [Mycolicibacterium confluentis]ORV29522.1 alpha/beta hydrolase [Mycolicibacterium confluentis]
MISRLAPSLRPFAEFRTNLAPEVLETVRASLDSRRREIAELLETPGVAVVDDVVAVDGGRVVPIRIYRGGHDSAPAVLYCHGGAFVLGNLDTDHRQCAEFARLAECTVISVDYRLAPENPFPAGFDDAAAVLGWLVENATALGVDADRIAVAGSSAGGALAARLAQCSAAGSLPPIVFQLLHQPVLDDRPSPSKEEFTTTPGFDGVAAQQMWKHYVPSGSVSVAAAPARSESLDGLVPALITCSELDPLRDEAIDYALRLMWSGVSVELHVFPGTCHGFDSLVPQWEVSRQLFDLQGAALRTALHGV